MEESNESRVICFRCPDELYSKLFNGVENRSKIIKEALRGYSSIEFKDNLLNGYLQFNDLFKSISDHFADGRKTISIEEFMKFIEKYINTSLIDKINKELE